MADRTIDQLVAVILRKGWSGRGIGLAGGYVRAVLGSVGTDSFSRQFPGKTAHDLSLLLKDADKKLVFRPHGAELLAVTKRQGGSVVTAGKAMRKDPQSMSDQAVMDFENILTTKDTDRDGDELDPKGAKVDPKMPLLWQHIPTEPIGKLVAVLEQTDVDVKTHFAIADCPVGRDAARLVEFGALRISHGFRPLKFEPIGGDDQDEPQGWKVHEYEVMEGSLVSIPANIGAVITAHSRRKSWNSPLVGDWAGKLYDERPVLVRGGWGGSKVGGLTLNVTVNQPAAKVKKKTPVPVAKKPVAAKVEKEEVEEVEEIDKDEEEVPEDKDDSGPPMLSDIVDRAEEMSNDESMPEEASARMGVVASILRGVSEALDSAMDKIATAAAGQDFGGINAAHEELRNGAADKLTRAGEELGRVANIADLPEGVADELTTHAATISDMASKLGGMEEPDGDEMARAADEAVEDGDKAGTMSCLDCQAEWPVPASGPDSKCPYCGSGDVVPEAKDTEASDDDGDHDDKAPGWTCPGCGNSNYGFDPRCPDCGTAKPDDAKSEDPEEEEEKNGVRCPRCRGSGVEPGSDGQDPCSNCGGIGTKEEDPEEEEEKASTDQMECHGCGAEFTGDAYERAGNQCPACGDTDTGFIQAPTETAADDYETPEEDMKCGHCGYENNPLDAKFCAGCGTGIPEKDVEPVEEVDGEKAGTAMRCRDCGYTFDDGANHLIKWCPRCDSSSIEPAAKGAKDDPIDPHDDDVEGDETWDGVDKESRVDEEDDDEDKPKSAAALLAKADDETRGILTELLGEE